MHRPLLGLRWMRYYAQVARHDAVRPTVRNDGTRDPCHEQLVGPETMALHGTSSGEGILFNTLLIQVAEIGTFPVVLPSHVINMTGRITRLRVELQETTTPQGIGATRYEVWRCCPGSAGTSEVKIAEGVGQLSVSQHA